LIAGNTNSSEMKIRLQNGSILQVIGTDNVDSIVGTNPIGCVFSEYSLQNPKAWQLLRPILAENGGWAIFNFTPRGANHAKELFDMASHNKDWFCQLLTVDDTGAVTKEAIEAERQAGMSEDMIQQEFYCSFTLGVEGSYYAKYMQEAKDEDRIGKVPHAKQSRVYTVWDIGIGDSCAIIFYQIVGNEIHIIDYYENNGEGLPHYAELLFSKPYRYADHFAPHDIENRSFSSGLSAAEVARGLEIRFTVLPTLQLRIEDGIEALRGLFPRIFIDATACKQLIKCLENYRKEFDERHQVYKTRPVHDWASHGADAARYLAIAVKRYVDSSGGPSDDDVERMKDKYQPLFK
jgi:phage terminase large subunit